MRKLSEVMDVFIAWIVEMVTSVCTDVLTHLIVYVNYVQF